MKRFFPTASLVAVISLLLSVIWPTLSNAAAPIFTPLEQVRAEGLGSPGAIAVDTAGNFYVADADGGEIFKFDRFNRLQAKFALGGSGNGLAVVPDGSALYVSRTSEVLIVSAATGDVLGTLAGSVSQLPEFGMVGDIELDADGNVYVADLQTNKIKVYDAQGHYRAFFGTVGTATGQFLQIGGVAISPGGQVVVADSAPGNAKVHIFTLDPVTLGVASVVSYANGTAANFGTPAVLSPCGLAFDEQGRGYLLDFLRTQIRVFSPAYAYLSAYTQTGTASGQLAAVEDLAYDPLTRRLLVSCDSGRIVLLGIDGGTTPVYVNRPPTLPVPLSPVAGSEVPVAAPTLQFAAAADADGDALTYQVTVYLGDAVVSQVNTLQTSVALSSGLLAENAGYSWTVEAFDTEGAGSGACAPAGFAVNAVNEPPAAPVLVSPLKGETLAGTGQLSWQASTDPDPNDTLLGYRIEVAGDASFAAPVLAAQVAGTDIALANFADYDKLLDGTAYFWRATAIDSDNLTTVSAAVGTFAYDTALLRVTANMSGASVYLAGNYGFAGRYVGEAPIEVRDLAEGALSVVVERAGFEPYVAQVNVAGTENAEIYAALRPVLQPSGFQLIGNGINGRIGLDVGDGAAPFLVDFDNDGVLDLLAASAGGSVTLFPSMELTSRGRRLIFQAGVSLGLPVLPGAVPFVADWNNDDRKDLLVGQADGTVKLFLNVGLEAAPAFGAGQDLMAGGTVLDVGGKAAPAVVDLNGDGARDLVVGNAAGQVLAFYNQGGELTAPVTLFQTTAAAVPFPVDLDADGIRDLLVTVNGQAVPYRNDLAASGTFVAGPVLAGGGINAVFAVDVNGAGGKDLLVGQADGKLAYWSGNSSALAPAALAGLLVKVDEVEALVAEAAPELLTQTGKLRSQIEAGSLGGAAKTAANLAGQLPAGDARAAVEEVAYMCNGESSSVRSSSKK